MNSRQTPWGNALTKEQLADGIFWVETAERGGILIEATVASSLLSHQALKLGHPWDNFLAFEQERAMLVVFYEHPELYPWIEEDLTEKLCADRLHQNYPAYF